MNIHGKYKILVIIFMVALTLRIGLNMLRQEIFFHKPFLVPQGEFFRGNFQTDDRIASDSVIYIYAARGFLNGQGILSMEKQASPLPDYQKPEFGYIYHKETNEKNYVHMTVPPLYSLFLALCFAVGGFNILAYFIPQVIIGSLTCVLIYLLAEQVFNRQVALFSGFAAALYPDLIFWASFARPETLFIFLLALGFLLLIKGNSQKKTALLYISAMVFGLASLTRITLTPFLPIIIIWQVFFYSRNRKESFKTALVMALIIAAVLFPWGMRNYLIFGKFNILSDEMGNLIGSIEHGEQYQGMKINKSYNSVDSVVAKTFLFIKDNFKTYLTSCWQRFIVFWSPFTNVMRPFSKIYKGLSWLAIFPAAIWGMVISKKKWSLGAGLLIVFILYYSLLCSLTMMHLNLVYRYPIQPFLGIFAGYAFYDILHRIIKTH